MNLGLGLIPLVQSKQRKKRSFLSDGGEGKISGGSDNSWWKNGDHNTIFDVDSLERKSSLIRIDNSSASPVVIGRRQLLTSFRSFCNLDISGEDKKEKSPSLHLETYRWAIKALSREMLRFSDVGLQIRGKHAVVRVNGSEILSTAQAKGDDRNSNRNNCSVEKEVVKGEQHDGWSVNAVSIEPGDVLSFEPRVGKDLCSRLEFSVVLLDPRVENEKVSPIEMNIDSVHPELQGSQIGGMVDRCETDINEYFERGQEKNEISFSLSSKVGLDGNGTIQNLNEDNISPKMNSTVQAKSAFLVHIFPFGNGFSASRRQKLEQNLKFLGATVLDDIWKAKYIVISESIRSLAAIAKRLHVPEGYLIQHLENNVDIRCVLPSWADHCITSVKSLIVPSRIHAWYYSPMFTRTPSSPTRNFAVKRNRDELEYPNAKQSVYQKPNSQILMTRDKKNAIQMKRRCFRRNVQVAEVFNDLAKLHQSMSLTPADPWKSYCFRIAAGRLLELEFEISNDEDTVRKLRSIKGFGKSVCQKIQECIEHGTISRIQEFKSDPRRIAMMNLKNIWGVGAVVASDLIDRGYRTIDDVRMGIRQNKVLFERNQLVGVDCYEDILDPMNRSEVEKIGETVRLVAQRLYPGVETSIMGSYRRGKDLCGDVDIQLTHPSYVKEIPSKALGRIIDALWNEGKIAMHLTFLDGMTTGSHYTDYHKASQHVPKDAWEKIKVTSKQTEYKFYMGCLYSPIKNRVRRRVDIKFYPYRERAFATLYFTGNGYFNRSMRLWASRVFGFKLNDHGLFDAGDGKTRVFEASSERDIFDRLQLVYREPNERHYWDALEPRNEEIKPDLQLTQSELKADGKNKWIK